jgi:hypothetical protein
MHVHDLLGTENLATEAGNAVLPKSNHRQKLRFNETVDAGLYRSWLHVDDVGRADIVANAATRALLKLDVFDHPASNIDSRSFARSRAEA